MRLHPKDLTLGTIFYEYAYGISVAYEVTEEVKTSSYYDLARTREQWIWKAKDVETGEEIEFLVTEGLEHYGPKIYKEPSYA